MNFVFDNRPSDASFVESVWRTHSVGGGSFISPAGNNLEMIVTRQQDALRFTVRGPETKASPAPIPQDAEFLGILFKLGTYLPNLPAGELVNADITLPCAAGHSFWLHGAAWELPSFENADTFVERLVRAGMLAYEPLVPAALQGQTPDISVRSVQRRFLRTTGLTHKTMYQTARAHHAESLLQQGVSILDAVEQAEFYDQPHMTRALKHLIGQTPAQIMAAHAPENPHEQSQEHPHE